MKNILWLILIGLAGCASQPRYDLDMSITDMSEAIEQSSDTVVDIEGHYNRGPSIDTSVYFNAQSSGGWDGFANNRFAVSRRQVINAGINNYTVGSGYELSFTGGDDVHQVRVGFFYNEASFQAGHTSGFHDPQLLGLDVDFSAIYDLEPVEFFAGIRLTSAILGYQFDTPVSILGETYDSDSLGLFGVGVPVGMHVAVGSLSMEAVIAPTLYLHDSHSSLGARNDLVTWNSNIPLTVGVGYNW